MRAIPGSVLSTAFLDGLVLAAIVQDDRRGCAVSEGLAPGLAAALRERLGALDALSRAERHERVRALVEALVAIPADAPLPPWAARILTARGTGGRPSRTLRSVLRHLVAATGEDTRDEEREAELRVESLPPARAAVVRRVAAQYGGERALGALMLGVEGKTGGDEATMRLRRIGRELAMVWGAQWR